MSPKRGAGRHPGGAKICSPPRRPLPSVARNGGEVARLVFESALFGLRRRGGLFCAAEA